MFDLMISKLSILSKYYTSYAISGITIITSFGLLRGRIPNFLQNRCFLTLFRTYIFSLFWLPMHFNFNKHLSYLMLLYLPIYTDCSEHYFDNMFSKYDFLNSNSFVPKILSKYFNMKLIKTIEIENQCIFAMHPHGIVPLGSTTNMSATCNSNCFNNLFPKLSSKYLTLAASSCFLIPGYRELLITNGVRDCSRYNAEKLIQKGYSIGVLPGGAREGLYSNPSIDWLDLRRKNGFIKLSMIYNIPIVPVYTFNEVDYYKQVDYNSRYISSFIKLLRNLFQKFLGLSFPLLYSLIPKQNCELITVIGKPVILPCIINPTEDEINKSMEIYIKALEELYNENSPKYNSIKERNLVIT